MRLISPTAHKNISKTADPRKTIVPFGEKPIVVESVQAIRTEITPSTNIAKAQTKARV